MTQKEIKKETCLLFHFSKRAFPIAGFEAECYFMHPADSILDVKYGPYFAMFLIRLLQ